MPLALTLKSYTAEEALQILKQLLKGLVEISSYGLDAKNIPYSHNNVNPNNVVIHKNEQNEFDVRYINFSSAVPCENVKSGIPLNNQLLYTPPEQLVFED